MGIPMIAMFFCGGSSVTSNSRMLWSFSRDGALPGYKLWSSVNPWTKTPVNAVLFMVTLAFILGLPMLSSTIAFRPSSLSPPSVSTSAVSPPRQPLLSCGCCYPCACRPRSHAAVQPAQDGNMLSAGSQIILEPVECKQELQSSYRDASACNMNTAWVRLLFLGA